MPNKRISLPFQRRKRTVTVDWKEFYFFTAFAACTVFFFILFYALLDLAILKFEEEGMFSGKSPILSSQYPSEIDEALVSTPTLQYALYDPTSIVDPLVCADTDSMENMFLRGVVTLCEPYEDPEDGEVTPQCVVYHDTCASDTAVDEYSCGAGNVLMTEQKTCPTGYSCVEGACKPARCLDTDGGGQNQQWVKGFVKDNQTGKIVYTDTCASKQAVKETYCNYGKPATQKLSCQGIAPDGRAVNGTCMGGQCSYNCQKDSDCPNSFICGSKNLCIPVKECQTDSDCPGEFRCNAGYCNLTLQCVDTDPRMNPYRLGALVYNQEGENEYEEKLLFDECKFEVPGVQVNPDINVNPEACNPRENPGGCLPGQVVLPSPEGGQMLQSPTVIEYQCNDQLIAEPVETPCPTLLAPNGDSYNSVCQAIPFNLLLDLIPVPTDELPLQGEFLELADQQLVGKCVFSCGADGACPLPNMRCNEDLNICLPPERCENTSDCESGVCHTQIGVCVECLFDTQCSVGEVCRANRCLNACEKPADCEEGKTCIAGACMVDVVRPCDNDEECYQGEECSANLRICVPEEKFLVVDQCEEDEDCQEGTICLEGSQTCISEDLLCESNADCQEGEKCNAFTQTCLPSEVVISTCQTEKDCPQGDFCNFGICTPIEVAVEECVDTDPNNRADITGFIYLSGRETVIADRCCDPTRDPGCQMKQEKYANGVWQYACTDDGGVEQVAQQLCQEGTLCFKGRCQSCIDEDTTNSPRQYSIVRTPNGNFGDVCVSARYVTEWTCGPDSKAIPQIVVCPSGTRCNVDSGYCQ